MGTGYGSADLCGDLAVYRTPAGIRSHGGDAKVCSGRRRDRGLDHLHGDPQHGGSGAGPNFSSYRGGSDHRGLSDRAVWPVWSGKGSICME